MAFKLERNSFLSDQSRKSLGSLEGPRLFFSGTGKRGVVFSTIASLLLHAAMILIFDQWILGGQRKELAASSPRREGGVEVISLGREKLQPLSTIQLQSEVASQSTKNSSQPPTQAPNPDGALPIPKPDAERAEYLSSKELDIPPVFDNPIVVPFPDEWSGRKIGGEVVLILYIGQTGLVEEVTVDQTNLPAEFGQSARSAFLAQQMRPGEKGGSPVPTKMKILVEFEQ